MMSLEDYITKFLKVLTEQPNLFPPEAIAQLVALQDFIASPNISNQEVTDKLRQLCQGKRDIIDAIKNLERVLSPVDPQPSKAGYETLKNKYPDFPSSILQDLKKRVSTPNSPQINDSQS